MTEQLKKVIDAIKELMSSRYYGKLTISFVDGRPVALKHEKTTKLD
jgi:hypothetical protein